MSAMWRASRRLGEVLPAVAVALALSVGRPTLEPHLPTATASAGGVSANDPHWSLQAGGWFIRVDGAEVDLPSLAQQTTPPRLIRGPQPLSPYDYLIAHHAEAQGLDWRLVAALIFEESRFDPAAESDAGAYGLMQVRPIAAAAVGAHSFKAPGDNIRTGARYLRQLSETFTESHGGEHLALVLAAYNIGPGHLHDAQRLARRVGYDPNVWDESMELVLPLLEQPAICVQPKLVAKGCARGRDTVAYVGRVLARYEMYRRQFGARWTGVDDDDDDPDDSTDSTQAASANG